MKITKIESFGIQLTKPKQDDYRITGLGIELDEKAVDALRN
jgi:hypothetical protein